MDKTKVYIRTYVLPHDTKIVLRSDEVAFEDMTPAKVREKYKVYFFKEVIETMEGV